MTLTLLCVETFPADWWQEAMPGVVVREDRPGAKERAAKHTDAERALLVTLDTLRGDAVSARTLKVLAGLQHMRPKQYSRLLAKISPQGWVRDGRGFNRCPFMVNPAA